MVRLPFPSSIRRAWSFGELIHCSASSDSPEARWESPASLGLSTGHDMVFSFLKKVGERLLIFFFFF